LVVAVTFNHTTGVVNQNDGPALGSGTRAVWLCFTEKRTRVGEKPLSDGPNSPSPPLPDDGATTLRSYTDATREIMRMVARSRHDEQPVFEAILEASAELCRVNQCALFMVTEDPDTLILAASFGKTLQAFEVGVSTISVDTPLTITQAYRENRTIHTEDMRDTELYRAGDPFRRMFVDGEGMRTQLAVPLYSGDTPMGGFTLSRRRVEAFSDAEIALVETFAAQAVIAIENARQFRELQNRLEREAATRQILSVINQSPDDEQPVFDAVLKNAARLCGSPNALLSLVDDGREFIINRAAWGETYNEADLGQKVPFAGENVAAQTIREKRVVQIEDLADTDLYREGWQYRRDLVDKAGIRTVLAVPLISGGEGIGCINLRRSEVLPFTPDQIALLETFAAQAVIAIENVRQFRELQTRLEREAATREILSVISQSRDDEQPVFDVILKSASRLCKAPLAFLSMANDERTHVNFQAMLGARPEFTELVENFHEPIEGSQLVAVRPVAEAVPIRVDDITADDLYRSGERWRMVLADIEGVRSLLAVPLVSGGKGIGAIVLYRREIAPFTDDDLALVQGFAAQAVIAVQNVRQFRELQTRLEREAATREILSVISQSRDDENPVFNVIVENAGRLCGTHHAGLLLVDEKRENVILAAMRSTDYIGLSVGVSVPLRGGSATSADCILEGRVAHFEDLTNDELYKQGDPHRRLLVDEAGARTMLNVPLILGEQAIGAITLQRNEVKPFSQDEIALIEGFAAQAVIAIENVRQFRALETLNAELGDRVEEQVGEIERMGKLKRFLSPAVADAVVSSGGEDILGSHRALIGILFCDIRGFTAFCETAEPEETIEFLQTYHEEMGKLINAHGAGVDHRWGDGIMVIFNDPFPCEDPAGDALRLALAMREKMAEICQRWKRLGHRLGFGVGVSLGYATVGMVGSEGRFDYTANGSAVNMAARLCDHAEDGEILLSPRAYTAVEDDYEAESTGEMTFKGIRLPVEVFRVVAERG
jgi:GAF domain-containing protein